LRHRSRGWSAHFSFLDNDLGDRHNGIAATRARSGKPVSRGAASATLTGKSRSGRKSAYRVRTREKKMFAVFKTGGKQYRVAADDVLKVDKIKGDPGEIVEFGDVLVVGGEGVTLGAPTVAGATVAAEVIEQARAPKIIAFKKRRRKNSRRKRGHRQEFTLLRITEILTDGNKPSKTARPQAEERSASGTASEPGADSSAATAAEHGAIPAAQAQQPEVEAPAVKRKKSAAKAETETKK
jgi:large subunit ribosomal protein L21